ncbi:MAG TPA: threonine--tRNA ligase [Actinomycetes bacterium]|nr:threonine--tRNA ligase [Actinomycetes bacterium]
MPEVQVKLPGGSVRQVPAATTPAELLDTTDAVAALVEGEPWDLGRGLDRDATLVALPAASDQGRAVIRHSAAHVLAQAVTDLYPGAKYAIGPPIEDGFYYDFDVPQPFTPEDLERIEARMRDIIAEGQPFRREELSRDDALRLFADQPYKREIIEATDESEGAGPTISVYANDGFVDLCRGPHLPSTAAIPGFKLLRAAGAYWRGDESRQQLQRIYGTAWESEEALRDHLHQLEEAERRDHRRLGLELDLFHFPPEIGSGLPVFHPKGGLVRKLMEDYSRAEHEAAGYSFVWTPHLAKSTLFEISGHLGWYADSMYPPMELEGAQYYPKPMNCPMHILIYRSRGRSYRELPLRLFEFGTVYRYERSGVIHGLARVRGITQDDAHIFCTREQLASELASLLEFVLRLLRTFGLTEFEADLATRPEKFVGEPQEWDQAEAALKEALDASGLSYVVAEGEGVFYAPKIDVHVRDAIGRRWQMSTLQVDFQLPHRFDLEYTGTDNARHRPFMIHRALFGSVERFMAVVLEHYAGALPPWLAPVQARLIPIADRHLPYAAVVADALRAAGLRPEVDSSSGRMQAKVRGAQLAKVPYILVVGDRDEQAEAVSVRLLDGSERRAVPLADFVRHLTATVAAKDHASLPPGTRSKPSAEGSSQSP